ncbi:MAG: hypothetical protein FWE68_01575 [Defluviitaleaceae bacterium]|nr:hypothetical protein [Defluviitaleaceae bacterium]
MKTRIFAIAVMITVCANSVTAFASLFGFAYGIPYTETQYDWEIELPEIRFPIRAMTFNADTGHAPGFTGTTTTGTAGVNEPPLGAPADPLAEMREILAGQGFSGGGVPVPGATAFPTGTPALGGIAQTVTTAGSALEELLTGLGLDAIPGLTEPPATPAPIPAPAQPGQPALVPLRENFDIRLGLYEQIFETGRSFLTTVPNGGSTFDEVYINFPANMRTVMEFNGNVIPYASGQLLTGTGPYVLTITCPGLVSGSENRAIFTFRILPPHAAGIDGAGIDADRPIVREFFAVTSNGGSTLIEYVFSNHRRFYANVADGEVLSNPAYFVFPPNVAHRLSHNGRVISYSNNQLLNTPGRYEMRVTAYAAAPTGRRSVWLNAIINFTIEAPDAHEGGSTGGFFNGFSAEEQNQVMPAEIERLAGVPEGEGYRLFLSNNDSFFSTVYPDDTASGAVMFDIPAGMVFELYEYDMGFNRVPAPIRRNAGPQVAAVSEEGFYALRVISQRDGVIAEMYFFIAEALADDRQDENPGDISDILDRPGDEEMPGDSRVDFAPGAALATVGTVPAQSWSGSAFRQAIGDDLYFTSSIPNLMIGAERANFSIPEFAVREMLMNGEVMEFAGDELIAEPGSYLLTVTNPVTGERFGFAFVILPEFTTSVGEFTPPLGYLIESVIRDGGMFPSGATRTDIDIDGEYFISLMSTYGPPLSVSVTVDTVPPTLTIEGVDANGRAVGSEVRLTLDKPGSVVVMSRDGNPIPTSGVLTREGRYVITVTDRAGNSTVYEITIPFRLGRTAVLFIVLVVLLIAGGGFYFIKMRKAKI